jgi:hypothetical protein
LNLHDTPYDQPIHSVAAGIQRFTGLPNCLWQSSIANRIKPTEAHRSDCLKRSRRKRICSINSGGPTRDATVNAFSSAAKARSR